MFLLWKLSTAKSGQHQIKEEHTWSSFQVMCAGTVDSPVLRSRRRLGGGESERFLDLDRFGELSSLCRLLLFLQESQLSARRLNSAQALI